MHGTNLQELHLLWLQVYRAFFFTHRHVDKSESCPTFPEVKHFMSKIHTFSVKLSL